ncbi:hypothetical protein Avbf_02074 [Armadillidium vulgare]|nr:hypothetical protein Avbf_02074 [Armadillidium vulgare]
MTLFASYNHYMVGDKFERVAPSLVFFFMLTCRLIVEYQIRRKEKEDKTALTKQPGKGEAVSAIPVSHQTQSNATSITAKTKKIQ